MLSQRHILVVVMIFYGLIMISPVLPHLGIHGTLLTGALFAALFVVFRGIEVRLSVLVRISQPDRTDSCVLAYSYSGWT